MLECPHFIREGNTMKLLLFCLCWEDKLTASFVWAVKWPAKFTKLIKLPGLLSAMLTTVLCFSLVFVSNLFQMCVLSFIFSNHDGLDSFSLVFIGLKCLVSHQFLLVSQSLFVIITVYYKTKWPNVIKHCHLNKFKGISGWRCWYIKKNLSVESKLNF